MRHGHSSRQVNLPERNDRFAVAGAALGPFMARNKGTPGELGIAERAGVYDEVIVMHVMAEEELTFPFDQWSQFRDLEMPGHQMDIDPTAMRSAYLAEVQSFVKAIEKGCGEMRIDYVPFSTRQEFDLALAGYLAHRWSLGK